MLQLKVVNTMSSNNITWLPCNQANKNVGATNESKIDKLIKYKILEDKTKLRSNYYHVNNSQLSYHCGNEHITCLPLYERYCSRISMKMKNLQAGRKGNGGHIYPSYHRKSYEQTSVMKYEPSKTIYSS